MARPRSDIRPRIVVAARGRFLKEGVDGASLRRIAKDAGTSIGMVYYYFETKDALFVEVIEDRYAGMVSDLERIFAQERPFLDRVQAASTRVGEMSDEEFDVLRIVIGEMLRSPEERKKIMWKRFQAGHLGLIIRAISEASGGDIDVRHPLPVILMATFATAIFPQLLARAADGAFPYPLPTGEALAAMLVDVLKHGLTPAATPAAAPDAEPETSS